MNANKQARTVLDIKDCPFFLIQDCSNGFRDHLRNPPRAKNKNGGDGCPEKHGFCENKFRRVTARSNKQKAHNNVREDDNRNEHIHQRLEGFSKKREGAVADERIWDSP